MSACFIGVRVEEFLARRRMISVLFERFSTLDRFYPVVVPSLSSKVVLVTLPDVRSLRTRVTHVFGAELFTRMKCFIFFSSSTLTRLNEGYASVCLSRISPCLYGNSIEIGGKLAHAILLMERCTRFGWESLLRTSLSLSLSNRYPLSDCLGIVTSVQSSAPVR